MAKRRLTRLLDAVRWSRARLESFRRQRVSLLESFVGHRYGPGSNRKATPINLLELAVGVYVRLAVARNPRVHCEARVPILRAMQEPLTTSLNRLAR